MNTAQMLLAGRLPDAIDMLMWSTREAARHPHSVKRPTLAALDLLIGYRHRCEFANGWWERDRRVEIPYANCEMVPLDHRQWWINRHLCPTWLVRVAPDAPFDGSRPIVERRWTARWFARAPRDITQIRSWWLPTIGTESVRRRLDDETGYRELRTAAECLDASIVYPPSSVAARFCCALAAFCPEEAS